MIETKDVINFYINPRILGNIRKKAEKTVALCSNGKSHIYTDKDDRKKTISGDGLTGQIGNYVLSMYLYGNARPYLLSRHMAEKNPYQGDGGEDILGLNVDIKASKIRYPDRDLLTNYHLIVRPAERHDGWVYFRALIDPIVDETTTVHLMGWASTDMLPDKVLQNGPLKGTFTLPCIELKPLPPMKWLF